jgi:BASS family bile acid:Na+ symporter
MTPSHGPVAALARLVHRRILLLLIGSYAAAALCPGLGLALRRLSFGQVALCGERTEFTLSMLLLALLLLNAGLGVRTADLRGLLRCPAILLGGLVGNLVVPLAFIFGVGQTMRLWHNPDEVQNVLVGLALVASMPVAGSSTAWTQNAHGNLALSLGLVLGSTLLSPLTTPAALYAVGFLTTGGYSAGLHELASSGAGVFLAVCVVLPSLLGVGLRRVAAGFVGSPEYFQKHYNNARDWLFAAYQDTLGRAPDDSGANTWLGILGYPV